MSLRNDYVRVKGATEKASICDSLKYKIGKQWGIPRFLDMPNSPWAPLGRDLLEQLGAEIVFEKGKMELRIGEEQPINALSLALIQTEPKSEIPLEITHQVYPGVWATEVPGRAKNVTLLIIKLKPGEEPIKVK